MLMSVLDIMKRNGYKDEQICNVYLCGSRLYGNITCLSDYDYTVIVTEYCNDSDHNIRNDIDITVLSINDMRESIAAHDIQRLINILSDCKLMQKVHFQVEINHKLLRNKVSEIYNKCLRTAKVSWRNNEIYKSKKHLIHSIRYVEFAIQIILHKKIIDLSVCNNKFNEIIADTNMQWICYYNKYGSIAKNLYKDHFLKLL